MPPFRRVDAGRAGERALGILVPPGARTPVIARPRGLAWDLLPARWDGESSGPPVFCTFTRDEAAGVARRLAVALEQAVSDGANPVQTLGDAEGRCFQVWVRAGEFVWVVCRRAPGEPYHPAVFGTQAEARQEAERLVPIFWPDRDAGQELYFNTQQFAP